jgi:DNA-binding response OmpR family regulator
MVTERKKLLVIEDDPDFLELLTYRLQNEGYEVVQAQSGVQAIWKIVEHHRPSCILLDLMIPSPNGYEICSYLKISEDFRDIPVIIISALGEPENIERALNLGANAFIKKPLQVESLINMVRHHTSQNSCNAHYAK